MSTHAPRRFPHLAGLAALVDQPLGHSDWLLIDQARIDRFAEATGDHQWIHVDPVRAAAGPFGRTIAHGFLTLSLLPQWFDQAFVIEDTPMGLNYGLGRVRFPAPVPVGSRLRAQFTLRGFEPLPGGAQLLIEVGVECEGQAKPVCVAESLTRRFTAV